MVTSPVIKDTPTATRCSGESMIPLEKTVYRLAPIAAGMLNRKLNVRASLLSIPLAKRTETVKPDLLNPGNTENPCAVPVSIASIVPESFLLRFPVRLLRSKITPVTIMNIPISAVKIWVPFFVGSD